MTQLMFAAFTMGMLGSFHCVGMCGPLALSLPLKSNSFWAKLTGSFLYNWGRIITYSVFGFIFGIIGSSFSFFGYQQWLSIIIGVVILIFILLPKKYTAVSNNNFFYSFFTKLRNYLSKLFSKKSNSSLFTIGVLNGLLPCGLVYMAAAGAVATGNIFNSILFMAFFGLGTLPIMWSIAFWGNFVGINLRNNIKKAYPYMMVIMACLLILRGMGLGIQYVSPKLDIEKKEILNCCEKK
ncbi:MAG: sulfite exporter TauE/SafE family protein [Ferruginibacter sp.]|nr:sulfite exporter TauE/SafE family protein [Ferruginibacter sp.]